MNISTAMQYDHRNGETTPPETEGWYWFSCLGKTEICQVREDDVVFAGANLEYLRDELAGQWFGPIPQPEAT